MKPSEPAEPNIRSLNELPLVIKNHIMFAHNLSFPRLDALD